MGVYAETSGAAITCKNSNAAELVYKALKKQAKESDEYGNEFATELEQDGAVVYFRADSGRVQNLEYQIGEVWKATQGIKGVIELNAPFLVEGDGVYFSNE